MNSDKPVSADNPKINDINADLAASELHASEEAAEKEKAGSKKKSLKAKLMDTVRQRKRSKKSLTQRYIPISEIRNDTVILKNGGLRAVLEVEPLNFNLKSEDEQQGIFARYQNFLNSLTFPIQIVVTSKKVNIDPYLQKIRTRAQGQQNKSLQEQSLMYADFVEKLVDVADIMQKNFYVVVPQDDQPPNKNSFLQFLTWFKNDESAIKISQRSQLFHQRNILLKDRINLVQAGLPHVGSSSKRLTPSELIELYYNLYNPHSSQEQKLPEDMNTERLVL